ncbi:TnsA endonuclease N-terminal domain-containing protein [Pseudomonas sp. TE3786]
MFESALERDFIQGWDLSPEVLDLVAQPVQIPFVAHNGRSYTYTPDFLIQFDERFGLKPMLVEVKMREQWKENWREWFPKWKAARRFAQSQGWSFHVFDENRIRGNRLRNVQFLDRFLDMEFDPIASDAVIHTVSLMGAAPFQYVLAKHFTGDEEIGRSHILHLLATRKLRCNLEDALDESTILGGFHERY